MFVASDNAYEEIYYHIKHLELSEDSLSQHSSESENEAESEKDNIKIDWVESLLEN